MRTLLLSLIGLAASSPAFAQDSTLTTVVVFDDNVEAFVHITTSDVGIFKEWLGTIVLDGPNGHDPEPPYYDFDQDLANLDAITPYGQTDLSNGLLWVSEPYFLDHLMMVRQTYAGELQQEQAMADILMEDLVQAGAPITAIQADISNGV